MHTMNGILHELSKALKRIQIWILIEMFYVVLHSQIGSSFLQTELHCFHYPFVSSEWKESKTKVNYIW